MVNAIIQLLFTVINQILQDQSARHEELGTSYSYISTHHDVHVSRAVKASAQLSPLDACVCCQYLHSGLNILQSFCILHVVPVWIAIAVGIGQLHAVVRRTGWLVVGPASRFLATLFVQNFSRSTSQPASQPPQQHSLTHQYFGYHSQGRQLH